MRKVRTEFKILKLNLKILDFTMFIENLLCLKQSYLLFIYFFEFVEDLKKSDYKLASQHNS